MDRNMTTISNIDQFVAKHFNSESSEYSVLEAKFLNSFFKRITDLGFKLLRVTDSEESYSLQNNNRFEMLDMIYSVDESTSVTIESNKAERFTLVLVLGNGDATTIANHSKLSDELEKVIFSEFAKSVKTHSEELYQLNWFGFDTVN